jgi:VanZ family protein
MPKPTALQRTVYYAPLLLYMGLIFHLSSLPSEKIPPIGLWNLDKFFHMVEYGVLGALLWRSFALTLSFRTSVIWTLIVGILYGLSDEIHQLYVPGRMFDYLDFTADALGVVLVVVAIYLIPGLRRFLLQEQN